MMDIETEITELKYDYVRLQNDLEKKESLNQDVTALVKQLHQIEDDIARLRSMIGQKES